MTTNQNVNQEAAPAQAVSFRSAFLFWLKLGFISFGGPAGQISIMHQELVENRRWISERRFLHALNYCMLLPGPEAQQLATQRLCPSKTARALGSRSPGFANRPTWNPAPLPC
jgi:hypothetical protein